MSAKTILYVEDNEFNRKIVRDLLKRTKYALIEAYDGEAGVATAIEKKPDLILMDIQLPKISGMDAMRQLRADPATAQTPIIAITSFALRATTRRRRKPARPPTSPSPTAPSTCSRRSAASCRRPDAPPRRCSALWRVVQFGSLLSEKAP